MASGSTVTVKRVEWSPVAAAHLDRIRDDLPHQSVHYFAARVEAGDAIALGVFSGPSQVMTVLVEIEGGDAGAELVVVAAGGDLPGADLTATIVPVLARIARESGCATLRIQTERMGLARKLAGLGFHPAGLLMRRAV